MGLAVGDDGVVERPCLVNVLAAKLGGVRLEIDANLCKLRLERLFRGLEPGGKRDVLVRARGAGGARPRSGPPDLQGALGGVDVVRGAVKGGQRPLDARVELLPFAVVVRHARDAEALCARGGGLGGRVPSAVGAGARTDKARCHTHQKKGKTV